MASNLNTLKRNADFLELRNNGKRKWVASWLLINFRLTNSSRLFGMTVSRKVGSAVLRNKLKRWVRESIRSAHSSGTIPDAEINFIFKPMPDDFYSKLEYSEFKLAFDKALLFIQTNR